jgi:hypothetical protein
MQRLGTGLLGMREKYPEYEAGQVWSGKEMRRES